MKFFFRILEKIFWKHFEIFFIQFMSWKKVKTNLLPALKSCGVVVVGGWVHLDYNVSSAPFFWIELNLELWAKKSRSWAGQFQCPTISISISYNILLCKSTQSDVWEVCIGEGCIQICWVKIPPIRMRVASTPLVDSTNSFDCSKLQYMAFTQYHINLIRIFCRYLLYSLFKYQNNKIKIPKWYLDYSFMASQISDEKFIF